MFIFVPFEIQNESISVSPLTLITCTLNIAAIIALNETGRVLLGITFGMVCGVAPFIKWKLQKSKTIISGPWDIAHLNSHNLR